MEYICRDCYEKLDITNKEIQMDSPFINKAYCTLFYNEYIRERIKDYKYHGKNYLYKPFGEIMLDTIKKHHIHVDIDIIAYIPAHRRKEALRGYNQAELLAKYIAQKTNIRISRGNLIKIKWTKEQSHSNKIERITNLRDSFYIKQASEVENKTILLVDDIITTGTTMEECSKTLMSNGARKVIGLALTSSKIN